MDDTTITIQGVCECLSYSRIRFSTPEQETIQMDQCLESIVSPRYVCLVFFTKQFQSQEQFDQLQWNFARCCVISRGHVN